MYVSILGRQPEISEAEIERVFGNATPFSEHSSVFDAPKNYLPDIEKLGGSQKLGQVVLDLKTTDWRRASEEVIKHYREVLASRESKVTLGISAYDFDVNPREVQKIGIILKTKLKHEGLSLRLVPNQEQALSTATAHHNKLGLSENKIELLVVRGKTSTIVAESIGAQNITALASRDQGRPKRDAFVGMLPPKLAQIMINLSLGEKVLDSTSKLSVLDPFCGTGVLLQEALLMNLGAQGTDLSDKMVDYSKENLTWITEKYRLPSNWSVAQGDAMTTKWQKPIDAVATETYLGQPFSAPPSQKKLDEVRKNCNYIITSFLKNIHNQIEKDTTLCIAVPAWIDKEGYFTHLPLTNNVDKLGYEVVKLKSTQPSGKLLYHREGQVVAREILILTKK